MYNRIGGEYTHARARAHTHTRAHIIILYYIYIFMYIYAYINIHMYFCIYMYMFIYVCIYIYMHSVLYKNTNSMNYTSQYMLYNIATITVISCKYICDNAYMCACMCIRVCKRAHPHTNNVHVNADRFCMNL